MNKYILHHKLDNKSLSLKKKEKARLIESHIGVELLKNVGNGGNVEKGRRLQDAVIEEEFDEEDVDEDDDEEDEVVAVAGETGLESEIDSESETENESLPSGASESSADSGDSDVGSSNSEHEFDVANLVQTTRSGRKTWSWCECCFKFILFTANNNFYLSTVEVCSRRWTIEF